MTPSPHRLDLRLVSSIPGLANGIPDLRLELFQLFLLYTKNKHTWKWFRVSLARAVRRTCVMKVVSCVVGANRFGVNAS